MKLFNTLSQAKEIFTPLEDNLVRMYVCGVTPYDTTHLGHAFTYVTFDTLKRYLEFKGYTVRYVQNVTDIDDDILRKSREVGMAWDELGRKETERYLRDMDMLNVKRPDVYARATEEIPGVIEVIKGLIERGLAYVNEGCVFYSVQKDPDFGELARAIGLNNYESMLNVANERGNYPDDQRKKDPLDFVLWQAQAPGEPAWESPWGPGRPGWHIECSSMILHHLGPQIDIHGGGADLAFPHHTCEIAQSEHYTGKHPFVRFWMHVGMVYQDGEKMSKSLGNLTLISDLLKEYSADTIRLTLLSHHYRQPWECYQADLRASEKIDTLFQRLRALVGKQPEGENLALREQFVAAMDDDFNTPRAIETLHTAATDALAASDHATGAEVLRLATVLGLCV
ncbi:cysteinyl-tRNA synthetase [Thermosporothrix hazakensis]|jgi:L-cysteine:1D-myo-inositol 2-amino-2-deoxy-alpha-D-glucopyranoside ligase|uniref:Cysteine--tRNA ligase n=1 Tax=Thermosporothrix hazakensis TaxID=644383 RepID=A0A326U1E9_THEHA|nr:cysteine--tRNA ligase [Thermosporothrix hazakensis]PZW24712.1 cysteinyl-tRNA synthetase [Thermosporothrix hazakensis]GCE48342.1 cysteine--tRNA ligase [Thermosporothrix hazakensis]